MDAIEALIVGRCKSLLRHDDGRPVIVGLSGGADSVALLAALTAGGINCVAAHCNFHLRGQESNRDMRHSESIARILGAEFQVVHFDTHAEMARQKVSLEMAARALRYKWFEDLLVKYDAQAIAVGHHREDNIETMFLNLMRGSGLHGLRGMLPRRGNIIRPMLDIARSELLGYVKRRGLDFVTDSSNTDTSIARNRLRHQLIPLIEQLFPGATDAMTRSLAMLRDCDAIYNNAVDAERLKCASKRGFNLEKLMKTSAPATLLFEWLFPYGFNASQIADIMDNPCEASRTFVSATHVATVDRGELIVEPLGGEYSDKQRLCRVNPEVASTWPIPVEIDIISPDEFMPQKGSRHTLYLDADKALAQEVEWIWRPATTGDRIAPFGMTGTQLLSDLLKNAKMPLPDKRRQCILARDGEILWVPGVRTSRHFAVDSGTTRILRIQML